MPWIPESYHDDGRGGVAVETVRVEDLMLLVDTLLTDTDTEDENVTHTQMHTHTHLPPSTFLRPDGTASRWRCGQAAFVQKLIRFTFTTATA